MEEVLTISALISGMLTFLAPCTLPFVPAYLGFISGVSLKELTHENRARGLRRQVLLNALAFVIGFSLIFVALGSLAGLVGGTLAPYRVWLSRIGGIFVILFGLFMLGLLDLPFFRKQVLRTPAVFSRGSKQNSFVLGLAFGAGWTPCVGPVLGAILTLAATKTGILEGAYFLAVFSLGLAAPFLIVAAMWDSAVHFISRRGKVLHAVAMTGGFFLVFLGILLLTDRFSVWVAYFYRVFEFINYDRILDYL